ncbi:hypothetical protein G3T36_02760 [Diaminobutyricibacter tongyongensis]|uniref:SHOCT domain-containing protein n=1 Tax=Leifsonia tongyongensis TaxID=1268043 RepID=A0A6L9XTP6_9MICO|nr:hypothetical protein [Diaminobutyricibacter tongyongensis]
MTADKKALASIDEILHDGEKVTATLRAVLSLSNSSYANPTGLLALSNERVIFAGHVRHTLTLVTHPLTDILSVDFERSVLNSFLRLRTGDATAPTVTTFRPDPGHAQAFVDAVTAAVEHARTAGLSTPSASPAPASAAPASAPASAAPASAPPPSATPAPSTSSSTADELAKIADLHDRGALTDEEFAAAKAKILGT